MEQLVRCSILGLLAVTVDLAHLIKPRYSMAGIAISAKK